MRQLLAAAFGAIIVIAAGAGPAPAQGDKLTIALIRT